MTGSAVRWLDDFRRFFAAPAVETYAPLFHPEGELLDAGMAAPLPAAQTGAAIALVLSKMPDLRIREVRHALRDNRVFVEASNTGTLAGQRLAWGAVYRVHLKEGRVHRGRRFYDQVELMRPLLPPETALPAFLAGAGEPVETRPPPAPFAPERFVADLAAAWADPTGAALARLYAPAGAAHAAGLAGAVARPQIAAYRRHLGSLFPGFALTPVDWAGDGEVLFVEWAGRGSYRGAPAPLDRIERYLLDGQGRIVESRAYFDTLALIERDNPAIAAIRAALIKS